MTNKTLPNHLLGSVFQSAQIPDHGCFIHVPGCASHLGSPPIPFPLLRQISDCQDRGDACVLSVPEDIERLVATGLVLVGVALGEHGSLRVAIVGGPAEMMVPRGSGPPELGVPDSIQRLVAAKMVTVGVAKVDGTLRVVVEPTESGRRALAAF